MAVPLNVNRLDEILSTFASLTGDAVGISYRGNGEKDANVLWVNDAYTKLFGYREDEVIGRKVGITYDPDYFQGFLDRVQPALDAGVRQIREETYCRTKDGRKVWASVMIFAVPDKAGRYSAVIYRDLSSLKRREAAAASALAERDSVQGEIIRTQDRLLTAMNGLEGPFAIWDEDFRLVMSNAAFSPSLLACTEPLEPGTTLDEFLNLAAHSGLFADAIGKECEWAKAAAKRTRAGPINDITRFTNGTVHKATSYQSADGDTLIIGTDITELETERLARESYARQLEEAHKIAHHQAYHDALTGLGNRRFLNEELDRLSAERRDRGGHITALHIDLDRFKQINDTRGHAVGDSVLIGVTDVLKGLVTDADVLVRTGGDEFVILCYCGSAFADRPSTLADTIVSAFWQPLKIGSVEFRVGASVGLASTEISKEGDLLTDSDIALYKAKSLGRGRARRFDKSDFREMEEIKTLSDDLLRGLEASEIEPYYQIQVDALTRQPVGLEALARWNHPRHGLMTPDRFLPIAGHLEVVDRIDQIIFEKAIAECSAVFQNDEAPSLSFNISHKRLMSQGVLIAAERAATYPGTVAFELLESIFLDDQDDETEMQLDALRDSGVKLEVDDFGSGHASIIALEHVAPDRLKIDRRLIKPITSSSRSAGMVRSIIDLGHALDIKITAEGVETAEHAALLEGLGCNRFQGYHFGRPQPLADILAIWWPPQKSEKAAVLG